MATKQSAAESGALADRAKKPISRFAGPYGHPFHPIFVTIPIGAWVSSLVFDLISRVSDDPRVFGEGAYWLVGIGIVGALVAAVFGFMDFLAIPRGTKAFRTGLTHLVLNLAVVGAFVVSLLLRNRAGYENATSTAVVLLSAVALGLLAVSGWLGARLSYRFGVRVVSDGEQADGYV